LRADFSMPSTMSRDNRLGNGPQLSARQKSLLKRAFFILFSFFRLFLSVVLFYLLLFWFSLTLNILILYVNILYIISIFFVFYAFLLYPMF